MSSNILKIILTEDKFKFFNSITSIFNGNLDILELEKRIQFYFINIIKNTNETDLINIEAIRILNIINKIMSEIKERYKNKEEINYLKNVEEKVKELQRIADQHVEYVKSKPPAQIEEKVVEEKTINKDFLKNTLKLNKRENKNKDALDEIVDIYLDSLKRFSEGIDEEVLQRHINYIESE